MPGVLEARYSQSATEENKQREEKGISSLPDDIVFRILRRVILGPVDVQLRTSLPLVCKKWREILYLQGRPLEHLKLCYILEHHSMKAVGRWVVLQQGRGLLCHPLKLEILGKWEGPQERAQDFGAIFGLLGPVLDKLTLDCAGRRCTSDCIGTLWTCPRLRSLSLGHCRVGFSAEVLAAGLQHLRQLETLIIWDYVRSIPRSDTFPSEVLCKLSNLRTVDLRHQAFTGGPSALSCLRQLRVLQLEWCIWRCQVTSPVVLSSCLTRLNLREVDILADGSAVPFPEWVLWKNLLGLKRLELDAYRYNEQALVAVACKVMACTQLRFLSMKHFTGLELQPAFSNLCKLTELTLRSCSFEQLPAWLPQLEKLEHLHLTECVLPWQQSAWRSSAPALRSITCRFCSMGEVSPSICNLTTVRKLTLQYCKLTAIDPVVAKLGKTLKSLDLSRNLFLEVPQELASLTALEWLDLSDNAALGVQPDAPARKMKVTDQNCRFLLHFPAIAAVHLSVTQEEKSALAGLLTDMERSRGRRSIFILELSRQFR